MEEIWNPVLGNDAYKASNLGEIKSVNYRHTGKEKIIKSYNTKGYLRVGLYKDGVQKWFPVSVLVWEAFNGPIPDGMQVNHINEDKTDNRLENLNLMTPKENCNWGERNEKIKRSLSRCVIQLSKDDEILHFYPSTQQAERETGISHQSIACCCRGEYGYKSPGGFKWKYAE